MFTMTASPPFPRLVAAAASFHWTIGFGLLAASAVARHNDGAGGFGRLTEPFLAGPLSGPEAAFGLACLFGLAALGFLWLFFLVALGGEEAAIDHAEAAPLAYGTALIAITLAGAFAALAGGRDAALMTALIAAGLFASAAATGAGMAASRRTPAPAARAMAEGAAHQTLLGLRVGRDPARKDA